MQSFMFGMHPIPSIYLFLFTQLTQQCSNSLMLSSLFNIEINTMNIETFFESNSTAISI